MQTESSSQPLCEQPQQQQQQMNEGKKINSQCLQVTISLLRAFVSFLFEWRVITAAAKTPTFC